MFCQHEIDFDVAASEGREGAGAGAGRRGRGGGASSRESTPDSDTSTSSLRSKNAAGPPPTNWDPAKQLLRLMGMEPLMMVPGWEFSSTVSQEPALCVSRALIPFKLAAGALPADPCQRDDDWELLLGDSSVFLPATALRASTNLPAKLEEHRWPEEGKLVHDQVCRRQ